MAKRSWTPTLVTELPRLSDYPRHYAHRFPDRKAAIFEGKAITYKLLAARIDDCVKALIAAGIKRGDHVAMLSTPRPEYLVVYLATMRLGAVWMGLNPAQQLDEYRYLAADFEPKLVFGFRTLRGRDNAEALQTLRREVASIEQVVVFDDDPEAEATAYGTFIDEGTQISDELLASRINMVDADDVALVVYTSGSTGRPKGAMLTHYNLVQCATIQHSVWPIEPLRTLCNLPVSHGGCCVDVVAFTIVGGGTLVFQERFDAAQVLRAVEEHGISWMIQVPLMIQQMLAEAERGNYDTSSLQLLFFGGAPISPAMIADLRALGCRPATAWGLTEATGAVTYSLDSDDDALLSATVGPAAGSFEVAIMGPDGHLLAPGETGEVVVGGPCVFAGYHKRPEATAEAIDDHGWLHTGDLGRLDTEGRLTIAGRIKHMFKSGGYNIYPREIEVVLEAHPAVVVATVVSVPDPAFDEIGYAYVLRAPEASLTALELETWARSRLANYKIPKHFDVRDSLPMVEIGKVDRLLLARQARETHGRSAG